MLVIWIGLIFGSSLQICSCDTNKTSLSTQKIDSDLTSLEKKVNISNNSNQNSQSISEDIQGLQVVQEGSDTVNNTSNEKNVLVRRDTGQLDGYKSFRGDFNQHSDFDQYQFEKRGKNAKEALGYKGYAGGETFPKDIDRLALHGEESLPSELDEDGRLACLAPFYQPAGRSYLGELSHKVSKLFGGGDSLDYYEEPFGSTNSDFQRHVDNLNNELMFRDVIEGNNAAVRKDVNNAESDLSESFQENRNNENDNNDIDDSWLSYMASDQSIVDNGQPFNIISRKGDFDESMYNDDNDGFNERRLRQIPQTKKSDEMLFDAQEMGGGLLGGDEINTRNINSISHESEDLPKNSHLISSSLTNFEPSILAPEEHYDGSALLGGNNKKRDVKVSENGSDDVNSGNMDSDSSFEEQNIGENLDSSQNLSIGNSQDVVKASIVSSSIDEASNVKLVSGENLDSESKAKTKHKRNGKTRKRKKIHSKIANNQDVLHFKMDDSLHEQSPPISSIDNGGGILLKDLDSQNKNKILDTNEDKNPKSLSSESSLKSMNDVSNKYKTFVSNEEGPELILGAGDSAINSSVVALADVSSLNSENEAKFSQNSLGESIMESIDGVKTLKLSSVNFKTDDSNESNLSSNQSNLDTKTEVQRKLHNSTSRLPIKLSHKKKNKKIENSKGKIVSSYNRNGFIKTTTETPASNLQSKDAFFKTKLFINGRDMQTKRKQTNFLKKGFKSKEENLDGFYLYDTTTTKAKKVHNIKKNDNRHKSGTQNTKMVKVKLSVSPCQFNKDKYLINNKSASKSDVPKVLSSRSVKQDQKQLNKSVGGTKSNGTSSKIKMKEEFDATKQKLLKQEKSSATEQSKGRKPANELENQNFFDKTKLTSTTTLQPTSNSGQEGSKANKNKNQETKVLSQEEIYDSPSSSTRKPGFIPMNSYSARKHSSKKLDSVSLNEDDACDGGKKDNSDDDEDYSDDCGKTTKSICRTTKTKYSTTEGQSKSKEKDVCDPLEDVDEDETDGPCEPEEDPCESTKALCVTSSKTSTTTGDICGTTQAPNSTTEDTCGTTKVPCETTTSPSQTTEAPSDTTEVSCETTEEICVTTQAPCVTETPCETESSRETGAQDGTSTAQSIKTEVPGNRTNVPCETTEDICGTTQAPCVITEDICGTTQAPCVTSEDTCETSQEPCDTTEDPSGTTQQFCETEQPSKTTTATSIKTETPGDTTKVPCETTEEICGTTQAPCETPEAPCGTTQAPCEITENPCTTTSKNMISSPPPDETSECDDEDIKTDPPCQTTKVCKTALKKGNSTSGENTEYVDEEDDDDDYDYEDK